VARGKLPVSLVVAFSVGVAISSANYFLRTTPTPSQRPTVAIPPMSDAKLAGTAESAPGQQTNLDTPPPSEELKSVSDKLSTGELPGNHPPGFRGLAWGSPPTATMIRVGGPFGPWKTSVWRDTNRRLNPAFGASVTEESYFFRDGDLYGGELIFDGLDNFRKVRSGLTEVLGPPNFADEDNQVFKWHWQNPDIELRISFQKMSHRSTLHLERKQQPGAERGSPYASASAQPGHAAPQPGHAAQWHDGRPGRRAQRATHRVPDVRPEEAPITSPGSSPS
jgi:hypothetical protein